MPIAPTYPGVYIEEIPSGVRTITPVATSTAAFVGYFRRGRMDRAVRIHSIADFEREFGGLHRLSEASYAIHQFFLNGGGEAWVVRTALKSGTDLAVAAAVVLEDSADGPATALLQATASNEGAWGNNVRIDVDYNTTSPSTTFNVTVTETATVNGRQQVLSTEVFRNLIIDSSQPNHVVDVVNAGSKLVQLSVLGTPAATDRPAQTGTLSAEVIGPILGSLAATDEIAVSLNGGAVGTFTLGSVPTTVAALAASLQAGIRGLAGLANASVSVVGSATTQQFLRVKAGTAAPSDILSFADGASGTPASSLELDSAARSNVQQYELGGGALAAQALPGSGQQPGTDGLPADATDLIGSSLLKTGMHALEDVDLFNILSIPSTMNLSDTQAAQVAAAATTFCEAERAFYILDVPQPTNARDSVEEITEWLNQNATLGHRNNAIYFPRPRVADPLNDFRMRSIAPSGTMAGLYARTDSTRGVWKAPAGSEATLRGVQELEYMLTDAENGVLNPLAINCFRNFRVIGNVSWGARTLDGADQKSSEWKYIPIRRLALFIEESLFRGTKWVVFEPNDEPLWAKIRQNVRTFMMNLFRQGAFQGDTPDKAFYVKCDGETTIAADRNLGIVNIEVGFAPLKPAEFVIIKIQQIPDVD